MIFPSESIQSIIKRRGFKGASSVVPTGVDPQFFAAGNGKQFRKDHDIPHDKFVVGHVGRLALSICYGILNDYNITIEIDETSNMGTTFKLSFPREN